MRIFLLVVVISSTVLVEAYVQRLHSECKGSKTELENGKAKVIMRAGKHNERRQYSCNAGYVMNVKAKEDDIWFKCVKRYDVWFWRRTSYTGLNLTDVKCEKRAKCPDPTTKENMEYNFLQRYRIKHSNSHPIQGYFTGDMYEFKCKKGFNQVSNKIDAVEATTGSTTDSYYMDDYMDYSDNDVTDTGPVKCSSDGTWNHTVTDTCVAITCDATKFVNISNGNITNYKDTYNYMEILTLTCDPLYQPIGGIAVSYCNSVSSFELLTEFGCEERRCPLPSRPIHGYMYYTSTVIGSNITFSCKNGYKLRGKQQWTCQDNEEWDEDCVLCEDEQKGDYCRPPCVPMGATWSTDDSQFRRGSVIQFECKQHNGLLINRTCMTNKGWSGQNIDCIGKRDSTNVAINLQAALSTIPLTKAEIENNTKDLGRTIKVGHGVDVYILVDISSSISPKKYDEMMSFTKQLLPSLKIGTDDTNTKVVLYYFASNVNEIFDCQSEHKEEAETCADSDSVKDRIDKVNRTAYTESAGSGTALAAALTKIKTAIDTKRCPDGVCGQTIDAQQVIILLSDGQHNSGGDPKVIAEELKSGRYEVEIYSIAVGEEEKGFDTMKSIASEITNERHFFSIKTGRGNLKKIISEMIHEQNASIDCGTTDPGKTAITNESSENLMVFAQKNAWPWMVGLYDNNDITCGGSLIDKQWILTAAHCFDSSIVKVHIGQTSRALNEHFVEYVVDTKIKHEKYQNHLTMASQPKLYDIALIKLKKPVTYEGHYINNVAVLPVCLFDENNMKETEYNALYAPEMFGVVTGWGKEKITGGMSEKLKQMQMQVKSHDDCSKTLSRANKAKLNDTLMFCAGGTGSGHVIDACKGDSGGPFVVRNPIKENTFIQTGIVSFGFNNDCNIKGKYGVYTKLTVDLVKWIKTTIKEDANKDANA